MAWYYGLGKWESEYRMADNGCTVPDCSVYISLMYFKCRRTRLMLLSLLHAFLFPSSDVAPMYMLVPSLRPPPVHAWSGSVVLDHTSAAPDALRASG